MQTSVGSISSVSGPRGGERGSGSLQMSTLFGAVGEATGAAGLGLLTFFLSIDPTHERLQDVLGTVALWCAAAFVVGLVYRRHDVRVQLTVHLAASLSLVAAVHAVLLERGDVDLDVGFFLHATLGPLVFCTVAVLIAATVAVRARGARGWRYVLGPVGVALAAAAIPLLGAVSGDPGDGPEAAIRRQVGAETLVSCATWEREAGAVLCAIDAGPTWRSADGTWGPADCVIRMGPDGEIARSRSLWGDEGDAPDRCRDLEG